MLVWQQHQGHQQQLQGEANAKDTRQEKLWQSPSKAKGFISHPQPRLTDSFPNEAFDFFIFLPVTTPRILSTALGTEELPKWLLN